MRVLLTGATGFVGAQVARALHARGDEVLALIRPGADTSRLDGLPVQPVAADLAAPALPGLLAAARPDAAIHSAWYATPGRYLDAPENLTHVELSLRLVKALVDAGCGRLVGVGTCVEYAMAGHPLREDAPTQPTRPYAAAKLALGTILGHLPDSMGLSTAWARLFFMYGPAEDERRLVPAVLKSLLSGQEARVSDGQQIRDYLHVADVAEALVTILHSGATGVVNVGSGVPVKVVDVVAHAARAAGNEAGVAYGAIVRDPRDPQYICADISRLRDELGFTPRYTLPDGLHDTAAWWRAHLNA